jgi:hypothetical protein
MKILITKYIIIIIILLQFSCKKLIETDPPKTSLVAQTLFSNNDQATGAIAGVYEKMRSSGYSSGGMTSFSVIGGMSSDELVNYNATFTAFYQNQLTAQYSLIQSLYSLPYIYIFTANSILEGLSDSNRLTPDVRAQLKGEAYFLRAFNYFYLVNMFGEVPLQLSSDIRQTKSLKRAPVAEVYQRVIEDLRTAEGLLLENYPINGRTRVNKSAAQAMLARTYLYLKDWSNAEKYASMVIANKSYSLVNYDAVFLANSQEAIWQLDPAPNTNANDGGTFIPANFTTLPFNFTLRSEFVNKAFEENDKRKDNWIKSYTVTNAGTFYYPFKYKVRNSSSATEYSTVLRLAEQYLIRAEARINEGNITDGISDLNTIRQRPLSNGLKANTLGLLPITLSQPEALIALENERQAELFCEWGHRWLDIKRWGRADALLSPIKSSWQSTDVLYPIPQLEISQNAQITQNPGY